MIGLARFSSCNLISAFMLIVPGLAGAQTNAGGGDRGSVVFSTVCASCHENGLGHAPATATLRRMTSASIYKVLTVGAMRVQTEGMPDADKRAVTEYLTGKKIVDEPKLLPPTCEREAARFDFNETPAFPAWGLTYTNARYVADDMAGINRHNIQKLKLRWAFGVAGGTRMRSHPALAGGAIYVGSDDGTVYSFDRESGCMRWNFQATVEVRTAIVISSWKSGDSSAKPIAYFGDMVGNVYAVDAVTGAELWTDHADEHPGTGITGSPVLYKDRLYVPVSSLEEANVDPKHECCTFRGSIVAYDAVRGKRIWQSYVMPPAVVQGTNATGTKTYGPSGAAIWNTPAVDEKRGLLYFGTGDNYSSPTNSISDAVVAISLRSGKISWSFQATKNDAWTVACDIPGKPDCAKVTGPDYDFAASMILASTTTGKQLILAGQKSGWVYALDPDTHELVWKTKVGRGGLTGGVYFGMAVGRDKLFVPVSDAPDGHTYPEPAEPGLYALDLRDGHYVWKAPSSAEKCEGKGPECAPGIGAAATATDGLVLAGSSDGWVRIYDADSGRDLWDYDTTKSVATVGGGEASGGSMGGGTSPIPYRGTLIVESGYGFARRMPGNVMLVFDTN
jgi:polyvinyl alcohol dehydrogenase (cytochrome)